MERIKKEYPEPNEYFHFEVFQWIKNASAEDLFKGMDIAYPDALIKFRLKEVDDGCTFTAKYKWSRKDLSSKEISSNVFLLMKELYIKLGGKLGDEKGMSINFSMTSNVKWGLIIKITLAI